jgi:hypothetical protein
VKLSTVQGGFTVTYNPGEHTPDSIWETAWIGLQGRIGDDAKIIMWRLTSLLARQWWHSPSSRKLLRPDYLGPSVFLHEGLGGCSCVATETYRQYRERVSYQYVIKGLDDHELCRCPQAAAAASIRRPQQRPARWSQPLLRREP